MDAETSHDRDGRDPSEEPIDLSDVTSSGASDPNAADRLSGNPDPRYLISDLGSALEQEVQISGIVQSLRGFKNHSFLVVRDRSGVVQCVVPKSVYADSELPPMGTYIEVHGKVTPSTQAKLGYELLAESVSPLSNAIETPVFQLDRPIEAALDFQLDNRAIAIRNRFIQAAFVIQSRVGSVFRSTLEDLGFREVRTPKIVAGGTEGGAEVFQIDYFGSPASLAQSPQLYKQIAAAAFERVYEIGPVFRAENSHTNRHLTEFTGLDFELALIRDQHDVMGVQERFVRNLFTALNELESEELELLGISLPSVGNIPRITWKEAKALVERHGTQQKDSNFDMAVGDAAKREWGSDFVFVFGYPEEEKPFYIMPSAEAGFTESFDLLYQGLEISSGGQRVHDYEQLVARMTERGLRLEDNPGYLQAYKFGMPPHGGAGLGLERITQRLAGLANVRQVSLFPRDVKRVLP